MMELEVEESTVEQLIADFDFHVIGTFAEIDRLTVFIQEILSEVDRLTVHM